MEAFCVFLYYFVSNNIENLIVNMEKTVYTHPGKTAISVHFFMG